MNKVLVVEDSPTQAAQLATILREQDFDVDIAVDGRQGLELCRARAYDAVVSDVVMPELTGYELCRQLKDDPATADVPVVLLTTLDDPMAIIEALACGADNFVTKPYDRMYVVERVREVIAGRSRRDARRFTTETEIRFLGRRFTISSDKEQILNLLLCTFEDIVRTNRELIDSQIALREADAQVRAHSAQLARSNRELESFAYAVSHDLKEPLRGISAFSKILADEYGATLDDNANRYLAMVVDAAARMRQLIDDLLAFARVGRPQSEPRPVSLSHLTREVLEGLRYSMQEAGATVTVPPDLPTIVGHGVLIRELLGNLVGNALKYRRPGVAPQIEIAWQRIDGDGIEARVADNGIGVPAQARERVFELFQRLHGREEYSGTGVGLALCKRIVEQHGGTIALEDSPAGGCTVRFTLRPPAGC